MIKRRTVLGLAAGALAAPAFVRSALAKETLTIAGYGGEFAQIYRDTMIAPFEKKFNVSVIYDDSGLEAAHYAKLRASGGYSGFDIGAEFTADTITLGAREGLLAEITEKEVPNLKYVWPQSKTILPPFAVVRNYIQIALMYHNKRIEEPTSWLDYWQAHKKYGDDISKKIATPGLPNYVQALYTLIMGARAAGGSERDLEPVWELLAELKPYIGPVLDNSAAGVPYLENEQLTILPYWTSRASYYAARGFPYGVATKMKEGTIGHAAAGVVAAKSPKKDLAFEFLNFTLEPEPQKAFCEAFFSGPGRPDITGWSPEFAATQVVTQEQMDAVYFPDMEYLATQRRAISERWQDIMA